jgi:hypothetical protein
MKLIYTFAFAATVAADPAFAPQARADSDCVRRCEGGACEERCSYGSDHGGGYEEERAERRERHEELERRERRDDDRPGVGVYVPGVGGVEVGR